MGDHSTDGWLEWGLDKHFAEVRAEKEAKGDFGVQDELDQAIEWASRAYRTEDLRRAESHLRRAGHLAAKEALFNGITINGWDEDPGFGLPPFERDVKGEAVWFTDVPLRQLKRLPNRFQVVANLVDNPLLRKIRQTGSPLIPQDREVRFARQRVAEAQEVLDKERAELESLQ